jgi:3-deoxy-D-manno-octulosonic-acid transferase
MGVLDGFYALADAAFVGGSLVPVGGHNLLEPAMHGVPVLTGPHLHNFREISASMIEAGGCLVVQDSKSLSGNIRDLAGDGRAQVRMGRASKEVSEAFTGASASNAAAVRGLLG